MVRIHYRVLDATPYAYIRTKHSFRLYGVGINVWIVNYCVDIVSGHKGIGDRFFEFSFRSCCYHHRITGVKMPQSHLENLSTLEGKVCATCVPSKLAGLQYYVVSAASHHKL